MLAEKCISCHGPDKQKGGLRVDSREALLTGGERGAALVPEKPDQSLILRVLPRTRRRSENAAEE